MFEYSSQVDCSPSSEPPGLPNTSKTEQEVPPDKSLFEGPRRTKTILPRERERDSTTVQEISWWNRRSVNLSMYLCCYLVGTFRISLFFDKFKHMMVQETFKNHSRSGSAVWHVNVFKLKQSNQFRITETAKSLMETFDPVELVRPA